MKTTILLLLFAAALPCHARLGETIAESEARYGKPEEKEKLAVDCERISYFKNEIWIEAEFFKGVCVTISYARLAPTSQNPEGYGRLDHAEVDEFLSQNSQGQQWEKDLDPYKDHAYWSRKDGGRATWTFSSAIAISSPAAMELHALLEKIDEDKDKAEAKQTTKDL